MNDEQLKRVKRIGNFSLAVTVALLATASNSHAVTESSAPEAQLHSSRVHASLTKPAGPSHNPALADLSQNDRFVVGYGNYYTNWSDYSNHSNYSNYYSNWSDYSNHSNYSNYYSNWADYSNQSR